MTLSFDDLQSSQAADINQIFAQVSGYGIVENAVPSTGARAFVVDVMDGVTFIDGERVEIEATSVDLSEYASDDQPRKAIIYVNSEGDILAEAGALADPKPRDATRFDTYEPSPPDISDDQGVVICEVWLGAGSQQVIDEDIRDRRLNSMLSTSELKSTLLSFKTLIDGSGKELNTLELKENAADFDRVTSVINSDENHGADAQHNYFSGDHSDLELVGAPVNGFDGSSIEDSGWNVISGTTDENTFYDGSWSFYGSQSSQDMLASKTFFDGGNQADSFEVYFRETGNSTGGGVRLVNSQGEYVLGLAIDNPDWFVDDSEGLVEIAASSDFVQSYDKWIRVYVEFDWSSQEYYYEFEELLDGGYLESGTRTLADDRDIESVEFWHINEGNSTGGWGGSGALDMWWDEPTFEPRTDHHLRYSNVESQDAVRGSVELTQLNINESVNPGYRLSQSNNSPDWVSPPMAETPILRSGTFVHTGGSLTTETITGITPSQGSYLELDVNVGVENIPSWNADYGYSISSVRKWDDGDGDIEVEIEVQWDIDPGTGNDLELRYQVYDVTPEIVTSVYEDGNVIDAVNGARIEPGSTEVSQGFKAPVYNSPSDAPSPELGNIVAAENVDGFGEFLYDGSQWTGPYNSGITSLSGISIDTSKNWGGYSIRDVGASSNSGDIIQRQEIDNHTTVSNVHHTPTVSSDIDHSGISNVSSDDHHVRYHDGQARAAMGRLYKTISIEATTVPDGETISSHFRIDSNENFTLERFVIYTDQSGVPDGVKGELRGLRNNEVYYEQDFKTQRGDVYKSSGNKNIEFRLVNNSGSERVISGCIRYYLEQA